ncbi:MFS transporter [Alteromonas sp. 14N.309.X.WAT.G.H12]|uniref:MFS transporter n=1 Tax=Alteromonas sp. 14N.309.X.WAT.G.H12 TaxID=3120824 RepID=UPI002FD0862A
MKFKMNQDYWLLSGAFFSFFLTWSFAFSLFPIWLNQTIGLTGEQTGLVFSVNSITSLCIMPCYGYVQDKLGLKKQLLFFVGAMLLLSGPFLIYVYAPLLTVNLILAAVVGGVFFGVAFGAGVGALETYIERVSRVVGFEFGKARMWGSLGWATATFFAGYLFNINPNINFVAASFCGVIFIIFVFMVRSINHPDAEAKTNNPGPLKVQDALHVLAIPQFWALATFVMGVACIYGVYDQQFAVFFAAQFESLEQGNAMFGYLNSFQVFLEAGGMFLAPFLVNRIGAKNGLILSGAVMALRILGSGFADGPLEISVMKLLHAVELPILLISLFKYISVTFDARLSATIYIVGFQLMSQFVSSFLSIVVGKMYDTIGFAESYKILGVIVLAFVVLSHFLLSDNLAKNREDSPQPF